jgi:hypothetical protein
VVDDFVGGRGRHGGRSRGSREEMPVLLGARRRDASLTAEAAAEAAGLGSHKDHERRERLWGRCGPAGPRSDCAGLAG